MTDERTDGGKWKIGQCSVGPETAINCANVCSHEQSSFAVTVRASTTQLADLVVTVASLIVAGFEILDEIISLLLKIIFRRQYSRQLGQYINSLQVK